MNRNELEKLTRAQMPQKRWEHTLGVMSTSVRLATMYGADPEQAELAALLHDYCKFWPVEKQLELLRDNGELGELAEYGSQLLHGPAAAIVARDELGVDDGQVLDAIRYHTSGRLGMSLLEKIVCLADYIEPGRDFPGVHNIREIAEHSLERALIAGFDSTIQLLVAKGKKIYPLTVMARNALVDEAGRAKSESKAKGAK